MNNLHIEKSELRPGLGLFTFGYPPSTRGPLSSAFKYSSLSSPDKTLLKTDEASPLRNTKLSIFTFQQHTPDVGLIYQVESDLQFNVKHRAIEIS